MSQQKFEYIDSVKANIHVFLINAIQALKSKIGDEFKYVGILGQGLAHLETYAKEAGAIRTSLSKEVPDLAYLQNDSEPGRQFIDEKWKDGIWQFKIEKSTVYVLSICHLHVEYDEIYCCASTAILSHVKADAVKFMEDYNKAIWRRNRKTPCVLNYSGGRMENFRKMSWNEIYLADNMVNDIRSEIDTFFKNEQGYKDHNLDWKRGIMLAGRPGNGKTAICRAIATTATVPVIYCTLDDDDMFRILDRVDKTIRANAPCCVIFEDADTLGSNEALRSAMLNMLDGLFTSAGVLTIASTNAPEKLDEAFTGRPSRFDSFYIIGDPSQDERLHILLSRLGKLAARLPKSGLSDLSKQMAGLSAACVQEVAVCALLASMKTGKPLNMDMLQVGLEKIKKHLKASEDGIQKTARGSIGFAGPESDD